jgi:hypothetical protein
MDASIGAPDPSKPAQQNVFELIAENAELQSKVANIEMEVSELRVHILNLEKTQKRQVCVR